ncbi:F-box protein SKIP14-like [Nicotiana sylvestris]|uniref:F-box protein SKIP14-like n=1 Tax=Nicotiana sylvestris TaxID=4096 RepID=A0A1U7VC40_NICSY|nr:PREDICTED: F-box protein SKIP14-like [Nicotiana sylvestris]XP_009762558.1 PREDICTED: F-box protein SKIP14-like [Nicotiana sylvestris]
MALNQEEGYLTRIGFDNGCSVERCLNDKVGGFGDFWGLNCEMEELYDYKGGKANKGSDDIADLLPQDPFNMDVTTKGTGLMTIADFLEDLENDFGLKTLGFMSDEIEVKGVDDHLLAELDFVLSGTVRIHQDAGKTDGNCELFGMDLSEGLEGGHGLMNGNTEIMGFSYENYWILRDDSMDNDQGGINDQSDMDAGDPSDALLLALGYLDLGDLLAVERVCKSLRDAVRGDPLLWRSIHIDYPLNPNITDDILIKLTNRAQGHLHSLSLVYCLKITILGLKHVLERNPSLTKLSVPGCIRLTADGILSNLKVFKSGGKNRLKYIGIHGVFGVTNQHFEEFKLLIGEDNSKLPTTREPRFLGSGHSDDDCALDIEVCPKCQQLRLVYDCPSESCQRKQSATQLCRACTICIERCINCGCCLDNREYEELISFELLCLDCWRELWGWQEREQKVTILPKTTVLHKQANYHFYLRG